MDIIEQVAEIRAKEALEKGREEGRKEEREKNVKHLLASTEFSVSKIAELLGVPVSFVKDVKAGLGSKLQSNR